MNEPLQIYTDGGLGNFPPSLRIAWVNVSKGLYKYGHVEHEQISNNVAEYLAVIDALTIFDNTQITIFTDSQLIYNQVMHK